MERSQRTAEPAPVKSGNFPGFQSSFLNYSDTALNCWLLASLSFIISLHLFYLIAIDTISSSTALSLFKSKSQMQSFGFPNYLFCCLCLSTWMLGPYALLIVKIWQLVRSTCWCIWAKFLISVPPNTYHDRPYIVILIIAEGTLPSSSDIAPLYNFT